VDEVRKKVLVADDNRDAADSLVVLLDWLGYEAIACYDGAQAVQLARTLRPDLVILDINMPVMDGYEAAKVLRHTIGDRLLLVAMTAAPGWETRAKAEEVGFDAHFGKPMDGRDIEAVLYRLHKGEGNGPPTKH
jgi:CheY-like chemotaxis protein